MSSSQDQGHSEQKLEETACKRIWIGGVALPPRTKPEENPRNQVRGALEDLCSNYGRVKECRVNGKGDSRFLHAVVTFESHEDAATAISKLHGMFVYSPSALVVDEKCESHSHFL